MLAEINAGTSDLVFRSVSGPKLRSQSEILLVTLMLQLSDFIHAVTV